MYLFVFSVFAAYMLNVVQFFYYYISFWGFKKSGEINIVNKKKKMDLRVVGWFMLILHSMQYKKVVARCRKMQFFMQI